MTRVVCVFLLLFMTNAFFSVALCQENPPTTEEDKGFQEHFGEGMRLLKEKQYDQAIEEFKKAIAINQIEPSSYYNVACCYSLMEKKTDAVEWLQKAVEKGWDDFEHTEQDADLTNIRSEPSYLKIIADLRAAAGLNCGFYAMHVPAKCAADKEWPLLIALHGYGGNAASYLGNWQPVADKVGFIVACPQGSSRVKKGSYQWNTQGAEKAILDCIADCSKRAKIDAKQVYLSGFSQGGALAYMVGLKHPDRFAGLIPIAAFYDAKRNTPLLAAAAEKKQAIYIIQGSKDAETLPSAQQAEKDMNEAGIRVALVEYPVGHAFPENYAKEFVKAIEWLKGEQPGK